MKRFSLKNRLIFVVVLSQILLAIGLVYVGTSLSRHSIQRAFDVYLEGRAQSIAAIVYYPDNNAPGLLFNDAKVPPASQHGHPEMYLVRSDRGDFEKHTRGFDPQVFDGIPPGARFWNFSMNGDQFPRHRAARCSDSRHRRRRALAAPKIDSYICRLGRRD